MNETPNETSKEAGNEPLKEASLKECVDRMLHCQARAPRSTYRIQFHAEFSFASAEAVLPYLKRLGVGDCYASPIFEARPGSTHGYDVTRHDRLNPELGGEEGFHRLSDSLRKQQMGLLLDIVPNHMGIGNNSDWWQDILENGRASEYADFFDIDWQPLKSDMRGKLLLPILGNQYGEELENKRIQIAIENGNATVNYFDRFMALAPRSLPLLFPQADGDQSPLPRYFQDLLRDLAHIPPHDIADPNLAAQRRQQLSEIKPRLKQALQTPELQPFIQQALDSINGVAGDPRSFDRLHEVLEAQPYRLAYWRVSSEEINYRRFFDINDLAGLRMENPAVFAATHCLIRKVLAEKTVSGLRIDHCDGMFNPRQYLIRLQLLYVASQCVGAAAVPPLAPTGIESDIRESVRGFDWNGAQTPLYVVVEKILELREALPHAWPVSGTSGYDFVHLSNQVFIQSQSEQQFNNLYSWMLGRTIDPDELIYQSKLQVMMSALSSETSVLTNLLNQIGSADRRARDFTDNLLEGAIRETIAWFPVYRTYIDDRGQYTERDRTFIRHAIASAKRHSTAVDASAFEFLENVLLLHGRSGEEIDPRELYFALKFQQLTSPVMAKGVEDTAYYIYNRFISSNEVGSSLKSFGISLDSFHDSNRDRLENSPDAMLATSTHDTKRGEDVRNRLNVLSEMPRQWASCVRRWRRMNASYKKTLDDGRVAPNPNEEYLIYQTIAGAWPWVMQSRGDREQFLARLKEYMTKALSEAKVNLSWIDPNQPYTDAVHAFLHAILIPSGREKETRFVKALNELLPALKTFGAMNSLAQVVLKTASPGVPDFYQGTEMWALSLVDPDNRRPVDYDLRTSSLDALCSMQPGEASRAVLADISDGRIKLWTSHRALTLRSQLPQLFARADYSPVSVSGGNEQNVIAFARSHEGHTIVAAVPRFACSLMRTRPQLPLGEAWETSALDLSQWQQTEWENIFTGEKLRAGADGSLALRDIFATFPVALFRSTGTSD
jgi:(1->4)-alpha-D-glucan 1-alpha-D-glucosylmutase